MRQNLGMRIIAGGYLGLAFSAARGADIAPGEDSKFNLVPPVTPVAEQIYDLHTLILLVCLVIFVAVFGVMFYSIYAHRKSIGYRAKHFHENTTIEVIWTIIPFFILMGMAFPATRTVLALKDTGSPDLTIKVTGYQWKWGYDYLQEGISFYSTLSTPREQILNKAPKGEHYLLEVDNPMVVPAGKKVRLLMTAADVIHAWWVPAFGVKQDNIPGFVRDTWFRAERPGTYRGQCAELCGKEHGFMPIVVEVLEPEKYAAWVDKKKKEASAAEADPSKVFTLEELRERGEKVYLASCAACHQPNGQGVPGLFPALSGSKMVTGPKQAQIDIVVHGKPGTAMAAFGKQLSPIEIAAVITYTRNAWANKTGEVIQPKEVAAEVKTEKKS
ncbi:MAG TPA: cytochrome c oxidase subunit II [Burkholderiales bacterium]|nr:cytochrome c oxidase subunit II [Burkholderiales bacterium]